MQKWLLTCALVLLAGPAWAQTGTPADNCIPGVAPFTVTSGRPVTLTWLQDPTTSVTDPNGVVTQQPYFIDGFTYAIDGGAKLDMSPKPPAQTSFTCPSTSPNAGKIPYGFTTAVGVAKGAHSVVICTWAFVRNVDASGVVTVTSTRQPEVCAPAVPFTAVDPTVPPYVGPPKAPANIKVVR